MKAQISRPVYDREEYYENSSRSVRWICLILVLITFPFDSANGLVAIAIIVATAIYNALRYSRSLLNHEIFGSRVNSIAVDHIFVLSIVVLSGGLASPYYPFFFLLIVAVISSYGIAGFAFALSGQVLITLILLKVSIDPLPNTPEFQFIIKLVFLVVFSLVAEQSVRSRDEEYLLESRFTNRIENERQRLLSLINSISLAVLAVDEDGRIYLYNAASLELLNTNRNISGDALNKLLPLHDASERKVNLLAQVREKDHPMSRQDLHFLASDGSKMILDMTISPVHAYGRGGSWGGYMVVFHDITKQKTLDEERDEFIAVTSHELRTPLAIAEANLSTAILPGFAKIEPKAMHLLKQTHDNIIFLSELIQDLTTLSRAERGDLKLTHEIINTSELANQLVRDYTAEAEAKKLKLTLEMPDKLTNIVSNEHELREILQNFITNAIKYTPKGTIRVSVEQLPDGTRFSVHDSGIGISASDKTKIFAKFYRSEDYRTRATGGTGLGLYITHKLAEKLGLVIDFESKLNHGSTFSVFVPHRVADSEMEVVVNAAQADRGAIAAKGR